MYECSNLQGLEQPTRINCAYVCRQPVKADSVTEISDLYLFFKEQERAGRFHIKPLQAVSGREMRLALEELQKDMQKYRLKEQPEHPMSVFLQKHFLQVWEEKPV